LSTNTIEYAVQVLRGMAYEHRLHLLVLLQHGERTPAELAAAVRLESPHVAHYLRYVREARLIRRRSRDPQGHHHGPEAPAEQQKLKVVTGTTDFDVRHGAPGSYDRRIGAATVGETRAGDVSTLESGDVPLRQMKTVTIIWSVRLTGAIEVSLALRAASLRVFGVEPGRSRPRWSSHRVGHEQLGSC